ncbi:MAG: hypothetical protein ABI132_07325 [Rhodanobacteraceae bacterium]
MDTATKVVLTILVSLVLGIALIVSLAMLSAPSGSARGAQASAVADLAAANAAQAAATADYHAHGGIGSPLDSPLGWSYIASKNEMAGGLNRFAIIDSTNTVNFDQPYEGDQHAHLVVRKMAGSSEYEVIISVDRGQLLDGDQAGIKARLDDAAPITFDAERPSDNDSTHLFFDNPLGRDIRPTELDYLLVMAQHAKTLKVQVTAFENGSPVFVFNVAGFDLAKLDNAKPY